MNRNLRLVVLAITGVPVAFAGVVGLGLLFGAPLFVAASDVLRTRPEAAAWAAGLALVGFPLSLGVAAADRELCRLLLPSDLTHTWTRRPWTWRRLARLPIDEITWQRLLWLFLRTVIGVLTLGVGWLTAETAVTLVAAPFEDLTFWSALGPLLALLLVYWVLHALKGAGWLTRQIAVELLGQSSRQRIAALQERTVELEERARLARELHDSVGHTVTVVVLQAAAAKQVLRSDPQYAHDALTAIEEAGRRAVGELADVLRLLRSPARGDDSGPGLEHLGALLDSTRTAGLPVELTSEGDLAAVPEPVSRVAYRLVQEACTNVLRHAGTVATVVDLRAAGDRLEVSVHNASGRPPPAAPQGGGHGLRGLRERVEAFGGALQAGPHGGGFLVSASIPVGLR